MQQLYRIFRFLRRVGIRFGASPKLVKVSALAFVLLPFIGFHTYGWPVFSDLVWGNWLERCVLLVFWIFPVLSLLTLILQSLWFLPNMLGYGLALLIYSFSALDGKATGFFALQFLGVIGLLASSLVVFKQDYLWPLIMKGGRLWRKHRRINLNRLARIVVKGGEQTIVVKNVSETGLCLALHEHDAEPEWSEFRSGVQISYKLLIEGKRYWIPARCVWTKKNQDQCLIGMSVSYSVMRPLWQQLVRPDTHHGFWELADLVWARAELRLGLIAVWLLCFGTSISVPACGSKVVEAEFAGQAAEVPTGQSDSGSVQTRQKTAQSADALRAGVGGLSHVLAGSRFFVALSAPQASSGFGLTAGSGLSLFTPATSTVALSGCISGLATSVEVSMAPQVDLVEGDRDCVVSLEQFVYDNEIYTLDTSQTPEFETQVGVQNTFRAPSGAVFEVVVEQQLPAEIGSGGHLVRFAIRPVREGQSLSIDVSGLRPSISFTASLPQITEGQAGFDLIATLNTPWFEDIPVSLSFSGDITPGEDFVVPQAGLVIPEGETEVRIPISWIDDELSETAELFGAELSAYGGEVLEQAFVLIEDNDLDVAQDGLVLWLKPEDLLTGPTVGDWPDSSGLGNVVTQGVSSAQPLLALGAVGGYNALSFGADRFLQLNNADSINTGSVFSQKNSLFVIRTASDVTTRQVIYEQGGSSRGLNIYIENSSIYFTGYNLANDDANSPWGTFAVSSPIDGDQDYLVELCYVADDQGSGVGFIEGFVNGQSVGRVSNVYGLYGHSNANGIGGVNSQTLDQSGTLMTQVHSFLGQIAEVLFYNGDYPAAELQGSRNYLLSRYNLNRVTVSLAALSSSVLEEQGSAPVTVDLTVSPASPLPLNITLSLSGSATPGVDYLQPQLNLTIPAFQTSYQLVLAPLDDDEEEGEETIIVQLASSPDYEIATSQRTVTLLDDEAFTPFAGVGVWLRADQGVLAAGANPASDGQSVTQWSDLSGNDLHATVLNSAPVYRDSTGDPAEGLEQSVSFAGSSASLRFDNSAFFNLGGPFLAKTMVIALKTGPDVNARQLVYEQGGGTRGAAFYIENGRFYWNIWNLSNSDGQGSWGPIAASLPIAADTVYRFVASMDGTSGIIRLEEAASGVSDQVSGARGLYAHSGNIGIGRPNGSMVYLDGSRASSGDVYTGELAELQSYNRILSPTETAALLSYLSRRYP